RTKFLHPTTVKLMGNKVRSLRMEDEHLRWIDRNPIPILNTLRIITLLDTSISVNNLVLIFANAPHLISFQGEVDGDDWGGSDDEGTDADNLRGRRARRGNTSPPPDRVETWKKGLSKLKALNISLGRRAPTEMLMSIADCLGPHLESLEVQYKGAESAPAMNHLLHKVSSNCPKLRDICVPRDAPTEPIHRFLESRPPLLYLSLPHNSSISDQTIALVASTCPNLKFLRIDCEHLTATIFEYLAGGPFLQGFQLHRWRDFTDDQNTLHEFLKHRGRDLENLSLGFRFWPLEGDNVLSCLAEFSPKLRVLRMMRGSEEGVLNFMRASRKLKELYLSEEMLQNSSIRDAASQRNVYLPHPDFIEKETYPFDKPPFPSYVEVMKESWMRL
ncbi:hypothetical protein HK104_009231, partial [Borealophlyctis nickersoniae]